MKQDNNIDIKWEDRVLCSDGNCIGILGPDGRCRECGKPHNIKFNVSKKPDISKNLNTETDIRTAEEIEETKETKDHKADNSSYKSDDHWENRVLCPDGNCIGVIGPDGHCKKCGKTLKEK